MKKVEAIINTYRLEAVKEALNALGIKGMTISEVKGYGRQKGHKEIYRGAEYLVDFIPKIRIEIVISSNMLPDVIDTIRNVANTNKIGDGKIFIYKVDRAIRIRTGEKDENAI